MFDLAIDSKLRRCHLVKIRVGDLVSSGRVRSRAIVVQQKTDRPVQFERPQPASESILAWLERRGSTLDDSAFPSRIDHAAHISTRQCARLVDEWVTGIGLRREDYGTHSLRRTKASIIYKQTGNLQAVQILLGHTKIESTVRYLGVDIEDALALAESTEIWQVRLFAFYVEEPEPPPTELRPPWTFRAADEVAESGRRFDLVRTSEVSARTADIRSDARGAPLDQSGDVGTICTS